MPHNMKNIIINTILSLSLSRGKNLPIQSIPNNRIQYSIAAAPKQLSIIFFNINICILLSYNSQINSGDKNDMISEKNMKHTIRNNTPVSALKNNFTKNTVSFITK